MPLSERIVWAASRSALQGTGEVDTEQQRGAAHRYPPISF
jgi:hypothetical protein